jgi:uncharacterized protein (TIGR03437 family)
MRNLRFLLRASLALTLLPSAALFSQTESRWRLLPQSAESPEPRVDGTIVYSPRERAVILFGGQGGSLLNDVWSYNLRTQLWTRLNPTGVAPAPRLGHTSVFDTARNRLVVFGGQARGFFSDVWALDLSSNTWRQLSAEGTGPSTRYGHSAIYDPRGDRMIITHGFTSAGRFDDTWAFDFNTNTWTNLNPQGAKPLRRCLQHAAYDTLRHRLLLYGGCSSGSGPCPQADLWALDLETNRWTLLAEVSMPAGRQHNGLAYDEAKGRLVIHGGQSVQLLNDTWEFDIATNRWMATAVGGGNPGARSRHHGVWTGDEFGTVFFGGATNTNRSNELWSLSAATAPGPQLDAVTNALSGEGGAISPGEWMSLYGRGLDGATKIAVAGRTTTVSFASDRQINLLTQQDLTVGSRITVEVEARGARATLEAPVQRYHPGIVALRQGDVFIIYATGAGDGSDARVFVDGREASLLYAGAAPGIVGLQQMNAHAAGTNESEVWIVIGGIRSNTARPIR